MYEHYSVPLISIYPQNEKRDGLRHFTLQIDFTDSRNSSNLHTRLGWSTGQKEESHLVSGLCE